MSGCFGNSAEDRYSAQQLNKYLARNETESQRMQKVNAIADVLLEKEYAPEKPEHIAEALQEIDSATILELAAAMRNNDGLDFGLIAFSYVKKYWRECALQKAEKLYGD